MILALLFILSVSLPIKGCPFYTLTPRTNFSSLTDLLLSPEIDSGAPGYACVGASINETEYLPDIAFDFALIGETDPMTGEGVIFNAYSALDNVPVFRITGVGSYVSFRNIQFFFNTTLFRVNQTALLQVYNCSFFLGEMVVLIAVDTEDPGVSGFLGQYSFFSEVGVALYQFQGAAVCDVCTFVSPRTSAVSVANQLTAVFTLTFSQWINTATWVFVQPVITAPPTIPMPLPSNWARVNKNTRCMPCMEVTPSQSPDAGFGGGGGGGSGGSSNEGSGEANNWMIAFVVLTAVAVVLLATINVSMRNRNSAIK